MLAPVTSSLFLFLFRIYSFLSSFSNALFYSAIPKISYFRVQLGFGRAFDYGVRRLLLSLLFSYLLFLVCSPFLLAIIPAFLPNLAIYSFGMYCFVFFAFYIYSIVERLGAFSLHLHACLSSAFNIVPNILYFCSLVILFVLLTHFFGVAGSLVSLVIASLFFYAMPALLLLVRLRVSFIAPSWRLWFCMVVFCLFLFVLSLFIFWFLEAICDSLPQGCSAAAVC